MDSTASMNSDKVSFRKKDWHEDRGRFQWEVFSQLAVFHVGLILAPFYFSWAALGCAVFLWFLTSCLGICIGFHRLLTHKSFQTNVWVTRFLVLCGVLAFQGSPSIWVGTHRVHHQHSDRPGDPHSPQNHFWWGHVSWLCFFEHLDAFSYGKDVISDSWISLMDKYWFIFSPILGGLLWLVGGMPFLVWGLFVRTVFSWHFTWAVNSIAHRWGYQNFDTHDDSKNNAFVALFSFGEGWHNNHHAFPQSARHGLKFWEIDPAFMFIRFLQFVGLATKVKLPKESSQA
jgi:fatty-acid desaturase